MLDLRFPTALQAMLSLAHAHECGVERLSSAELASGLGANPSLVRRLLGRLVDAGMLTSTLGKHGGLSLARAPETIRLSEIYAAATEHKPLWVARGDIPHRCLVTSNVEAYFGELAGQAEAALTTTLDRSTLADALSRLKVLNARRAAPASPRRRSPPTASRR